MVSGGAAPGERALHACDPPEACQREPCPRPLMPPASIAIVCRLRFFLLARRLSFLLAGWLGGSLGVGIGHLEVWTQSANTADTNSDSRDDKARKAKEDT